MKSAEALSTWRTRWAEVNAVTDGEARGLSPAERLAALVRLRSFGVVKALGPTDDDEEAWARFEQLRTRYRGRRG